jgi:hypothetical protein
MLSMARRESTMVAKHNSLSQRERARRAGEQRALDRRSITPPPGGYPGEHIHTDVCLLLPNAPRTSERWNCWDRVPTVPGTREGPDPFISLLFRLTFWPAAVLFILFGMASLATIPSSENGLTAVNALIAGAIFIGGGSLVGYMLVDTRRTRRRTRSARLEWEAWHTSHRDAILELHREAREGFWQTRNRQQDGLTG